MLITLGRQGLIQEGSAGFYEITTHPQSVVDWQEALFANYGNPLVMIGVSLLVFPRLALGLSGFETGVGMMPLVRGGEGDDPRRPSARSGHLLVNG